MPLKTDTVEEPNLNLTPMIDIVFLLIIFFMVGTQFSEMEREFDVDLPRVSDARPLTSLPDEIVVNVRADGAVGVDGDRLSLKRLHERLTAARKNYADQAVVIRGDAGVPYQRVMEVLSACHQAGIDNVSLANRLKEDEA